MTMTLKAATERLQRAETDPQGLPIGDVTRLERLILDHDPQSIPEAVAMLNVALPDLVAGGRTDGRDIGAVSRVRDFLRGMSR